MVHKITFDSGRCPQGEMVSLACGHISLNEITFAQQGIVLVVESRTGAVEFCDLEGKKLLSAKAELPGGDEKFSELHCAAEGGQIVLGLPQYTYKDNYPNCDGEYDRWTKMIAGYRYLRYDIKNNCLS